MSTRATTTSDDSSGDEDDIELTFQRAKSMKVQELRNELEKRGVNSKGKKKTLINRVKYYASRGQYIYHCF